MENAEAHAAAPGASAGEALRMRLLNEIQARAWPATQRRLVLRFLATPLEIVGSERVSAIQVADNELVTQADGTTAARSHGRPPQLDTRLGRRSVGTRGPALVELPFD